MKNLRNLIASDSDSFNEKLKIVFYSFIGVKFFLICAILFGGCESIEDTNKIDQEISVLGQDRYCLMTTTWCYSCTGSSLILLTLVYDGYDRDYNDGGNVYRTKILNDSVKVSQYQLAERHLARTLDRMKILK